MKVLLKILLLILPFVGTAQIEMVMTPQGFTPMEFATPDKPSDKLIQSAKSWAAYYNKKGYDTYDITENSLSIDGFKENAYFYRNLGETYDYHIRYKLKIVFGNDKKYALTFAVKEVYAKDVLIRTTISDFFTPSGNLKEDFKEVKPSLENTAENIVNSFVTYLQN